MRRGRKAADRCAVAVCRSGIDLDDADALGAPILLAAPWPWPRFGLQEEAAGGMSTGAAEFLVLTY